ncbi:MAG: chemotaxis protein MotB, partial [Elusimicrobiota bacterium]
MNTQLESVQKSNKDLRQSLEANQDQLSKKVADLTKEKDGLTRKLALASAAVVGRDADLARLREEKAAVEKAKEDERLALEAAKAAELAKVKQSYEDLTASLKSEISAGEVTITQLKGKLTVNMVDRVLFDSGQAEVRSDGKKVLEKVGKILSGVADKDIRIEGHTDNKPIVGEL